MGVLLSYQVCAGTAGLVLHGVCLFELHSLRDAAEVTACHEVCDDDVFQGWGLQVVCVPGCLFGGLFWWFGFGFF